MTKIANPLTPVYQPRSRPRAGQTGFSSPQRDCLVITRRRQAGDFRSFGIAAIWRVWSNVLVVKNNGLML
jgi:hypothetical protein